MRFLLFSIDNAIKLCVFCRNAARFARSIAGDPQALRAWGSPFRNRGLVVGREVNPKFFGYPAQNLLTGIRNEEASKKLELFDRNASVHGV